jgi:hypothetical protein
MDRLTVALVFTLASCQVFAAICLGILRGGFYYTSYQPSFEGCVLGRTHKTYEEYGSNEEYNSNEESGSYSAEETSIRSTEQTVQVCRFGMSVAYMSMILSLLMLCEESLKRTRKYTSTVIPFGSNLSTLQIFASIAMAFMWIASFGYSLWGWIVTDRTLNEDFNDLDVSTPALRVPTAFYIIFHAFSAVSWGIVAILTKRRMTTLYMSRPEADNAEVEHVTPYTQMLQTS